MMPTWELNSEWFFPGKKNNSHLDKAKIHDSSVVISDGMTRKKGENGQAMEKFSLLLALLPNGHSCGS